MHEIHVLQPQKAGALGIRHDSSACLVRQFVIVRPLWLVDGGRGECAGSVH